MKVRARSRVKKKPFRSSAKSRLLIRTALRKATKGLNIAVRRLRKGAPAVRAAVKSLRKRAHEIKKFSSSTVHVGVLGSSSSYLKGRKTVLDIAVIHEFGTSRIPRRSFIRGYVDEKRSEINEAIRRMSGSVVLGKRTSNEALNLLGQAFAGGMQRRIANRIPPPLAQSTIDRKGSDVPLIDTGQLRTSITYKVRSK